MSTIQNYLETRTTARLVRDGIPSDLAARVAVIHPLCWGARIDGRKVFLDVDDDRTRKGWITIRLGGCPTTAALEDAILEAAR